jgi:hypothetical protein
VWNSILNGVLCCGVGCFVCFVAHFDWGARWRVYVTGEFIYNSPNLVWLTICVAVYILFPYTDALRVGVTVAFVKQRALINALLVLFFFGFWHITLYHLGFAKRPFMPDRKYRYSKVAHNVFYSLVGSLVWTGFECAMVQVYHNGRVSYIADSEVFGSLTNVASVVSWVFLGAIVRDLHL